MGDIPFGFAGSGSGSGPGDSGGSGSGGSGGGPLGFGAGGGPSGDDDPFGLGAMFGGADLGEMLTRLGQALSYKGGPVNWDLATQVATQAAAADDPMVTSVQRSEVVEALRLADVWLDGATALAAAGGTAQAWSRREWVAGTLATWRLLCDPVAERVVAAMGQALPAQIPDEMRAMAGPLLGMMGQIGGVVFGQQLGAALGSLAGEVVAATEVGLPLGPAGTSALLPSGVARLGAGLGVPLDQVRLYLALREAAHQRLYAHVPWLRGRVTGAVQDYARGIRVDVDAITEAMSGLDPSDPESLSQVLGGGMFEPTTTPEQKAALARLETLLALVEGWVDTVVDRAAAGRLPAAGQLREVVRRRRAAGGPAEQTFATLVGLELRPRRLREAAALWAALEQERGTEGRDAVWEHPDLLPGPSDLDDPAAFVAAGSAGQRAASEAGGTDFDAELARLLDNPSSAGPPQEPGPGEGRPGDEAPPASP